MLNLLIAGFLVAPPAFASTPSPIQTKEDVLFVHKNDQKLLGFANPDSFVGVYKRMGEKEKSLSQVELYSLTGIESLKMDEALCKQALTKMFGPLNEIALKAQDIKIWNSHTGKTCEAAMVDPDKASPIPERRVLIGFVNAKPYAVVFKLPQKSTAEQQSNMRSFWDSLR